MLALAGPEMPKTRPARRELVGRVIALDSVIDEAIGESSQLRYNSPRRPGQLAHGSGCWRGCRTTRLGRPMLSCDAFRRAAIGGARRASGLDGRSVRQRRACETAVRTLIALPADTPAVRLLTDQTAKVLAGMPPTHQFYGCLPTRRLRWP
jgi:hypothetical protein